MSKKNKQIHLKDLQRNISQNANAVMNALQNHFVLSNKEEKADYHAKIK